MEKKNNNASEKRTLLLSVLMSSPGPIVVGLGLIVGKSSTQLSDFVRRSAELVGIIAAYITYLIANSGGRTDEEKKSRVEKISNIIVGLMMLTGGSIMLALSFISENSETGNVIPGLSIAILGVIANTLFWIKYSRLNRVTPNAIIAVQARLYRAKSLVDICVSSALLSVALFPGTRLSSLLDTAGSAIVASYLVWCGIKTVFEAVKRKGET